MRRILFILVVLFLITCSLQSQTEYLENSKVLLIGPDNVNFYIKEQQDFYVQKYENLLLALNKTKTENDYNLKIVQSYRRIKKKDKRLIEELEASSRVIQNEIDTTNYFIDLWLELPVNSNDQILNNVDFENNCYNLISEEGVHSPKEYKIISLVKDGFVGWQEQTERKTEQILLKKATTKWVKQKTEKNCLSDDPDDCAFWCLIKLPAEYKTIVIEDDALACFENYSLSESKDKCVREVKFMLDIQDSKPKKLKAISLRDNSEINPIDIKKVECN